MDELQKQFDEDCQAVEEQWREVGKPLWAGLLARFPVDMEGE